LSTFKNSTPTTTVEILTKGQKGQYIALPSQTQRTNFF
jgi:hypothetical protein